MKEKNKAGRVSKKTIATVLIAMIGTVGIGMCMSIDCKGVVDLLCLI